MLREEPAPPRLARKKRARTWGTFDPFFFYVFSISQVDSLVVTRLLHFPATMGAVKPTIFVVEDDPDISRLVRHHLEGASFNVRLYSTGNLVVVDAERQRPALFLLDIMVPGKDGLELCRQIRQSVTLASVPVIFLTAKSGEAALAMTHTVRDGSVS